MAGQDVGHVVGVVVAVADQLAVDVELVAESVERGVVDPGGPDIPARRHVGPVVAIGVPVQVLAEQRRLVTGVVEERRHGDGFVSGAEERGEPGIVARVAQHAMIVGVLAAQDGGAGGATERRRGEEPRKGRALLYEEATDCRHVRDRGGIEVVDHDDDEVGPGLGIGDGEEGWTQASRDEDARQQQREERRESSHVRIADFRR